jgi:hypothetical protein
VKTFSTRSHFTAVTTGKVFPRVKQLFRDTSRRIYWWLAVFSSSRELALSQGRRGLALRNRLEPHRHGCCWPSLSHPTPSQPHFMTSTGSVAHGLCGPRACPTPDSHRLHLYNPLPRLLPNASQQKQFSFGISSLLNPRSHTAHEKEGIEGCTSVTYKSRDGGRG